MDLSNYGHALAGLAYFFFALRLLREPLPPGADGKQRRWLALSVVATALWGCAAAGLGWVGRPHVPAVLGVELLDLLRYAGWFAFLLSITADADRGAVRVMRWLARGFVTAALVILGLWGIGPTRGLTLVWLGMPILAMVLLEQLIRNVPSDFRWHAKPLGLALAATFVFDIYLYSQAALFGQFDLDVLTMRGFAHALAVPFLFIALRRQSDRSFRLRVSREAAFHSATLVLVGGYLLFVSGIGYYVREFGGNWGPALQIGLLSAGLLALAVLLLSSELRARVRVFIGKNFFRYRFDYRSEWLRFTEMLSDRRSPRETGDLVIRGLAQMVHSPSGALWSVDPAGATSVQVATWNMPPSLEKVALDSPLAAFLQRTEWIVDLDEYRRMPARYDGLQLPAWLLELPQAWVVVPLLVAQELTGFVVLGRSHAGTHLNWEVRDLLKTAARQAASFLALMQATETLLEVRKFDAFNRMSAFVVHDLKNIVAQLSLMMQNARRLKDNPEFQEDMLATVESSLEKMRRLMLQLREGQAPAGVVSGVELLPIVQRLKASAVARGRDLELRIEEPVVTRGQDERIERVLGHLIQNALDATEARGGEVWVALSRAGSQAKVVVGDTGCGMSQEFVHMRLFKPFSSTKHNGMGIGAYESFQYVRELGGSLSVDSEVDRGTVVTVLLPLFEVKQRSNLELLGAK